jgi:hypothetical protein
MCPTPTGQNTLEPFASLYRLTHIAAEAMPRGLCRQSRLGGRCARWSRQSSIATGCLDPPEFLFVDDAENQSSELHNRQALEFAIVCLGHDHF